MGRSNDSCPALRFEQDSALVLRKIQRISWGGGPGTYNVRQSSPPFRPAGDLLAVLSYFRFPFPSTKGFSAYRMPGVAVHGPLILTFTAVGFFLCWPHTMLRPALIVWLVAGLYLGRDIAVLCHYTPLLTLISWAVSTLVLLKAGLIASFGASHTLIAAILSVALAGLLCVVSFKMTRGLDSGSTTVPPANRSQAL